jgi:anti-anti-sigma factor
MSTQTHPLPDSVECEPGLRKGMGSSNGAICFCPACEFRVNSELNNNSPCPRCRKRLWFVRRPLGDAVVLTFLSGTGTDSDVFWRVDELRSGLEDFSRFVLDLSHLPNISSIFLGMLIRLHRRAVRDQERMRICGLHPEVIDVLRASVLSGLFEVYENEEEALGADAPGTCP